MQLAKRGLTSTNNNAFDRLAPMTDEYGESGYEGCPVQNSRAGGQNSNTMPENNGRHGELTYGPTNLPFSLIPISPSCLHLGVRTVRARQDLRLHFAGREKSWREKGSYRKHFQDVG